MLKALLVGASAAIMLLNGQFVRSTKEQVLDDAKRSDPESLYKDITKVDVNLVLVPVTVTDQAGRTVTGLSAGNFEVFEDGVPQNIVHFNAQDAPCSIGLLFDVSGSMERKLSRALLATRAFSENTNPGDEVFLITFSGRPELRIGFTSAFGEVHNSLLFTTPTGKTALIDAVYLALQHMGFARNARKALLIVSDGGDNHSRHSERELMRTLSETDIQIYAIGIHDRRTGVEERRGRYLLSKMARRTGGLHYETRNVTNKLNDTARRIALAMHDQYVLSYRPPPNALPDKWRRIRVKVKLPDGRDVRAYTRPGYYAPH